MNIYENIDSYIELSIKQKDTINKLQRAYTQKYGWSKVLHPNKIIISRKKWSDFKQNTERLLVNIDRRIVLLGQIKKALQNKNVGL